MSVFLTRHTFVTSKLILQCVSEKTSRTFLAVTLESIVGFSCLAHMLLRKQAISRCYSFPPHLTSASALPEKMQ